MHAHFQRGLTGTAPTLVVADGGAGLWAALPLVYPQVPVQRCWAHKTRNVLAKVRRADQAAVKRTLPRISHAATLRQAQHAAQRFATTWQTPYPEAVRCLTRDLPELLTFLRVPVGLPATAARTTNAIEGRSGDPFLPTQNT